MNSNQNTDRIFANSTLKSKALVAAIETGLVPKAKTADGYDIAPFLRFWDAFSGPLKEAMEKQAYFVEVLDEKGDE